MQQRKPYTKSLKQRQKEHDNLVQKQKSKGVRFWEPPITSEWHYSDPQTIKLKLNLSKNARPQLFMHIYRDESEDVLVQHYIYKMELGTILKYESVIRRFKPSHWGMKNLHKYLQQLYLHWYPTFPKKDSRRIKSLRRTYKEHVIEVHKPDMK